MPRMMTLIFAAVMAFATTGATAQSSSPLVADGLDRETLRKEIREYLLEDPEILMEMFAILEEKQKAEGIQTDLNLVSDNAAEIFDDGFSFVAGNPEGDLTIVEFLDYQCSYCRRAHPQISTLLDEDSNIRLIVKEFPILGPNSELASRAAVSTLISEGGAAYHDLNNRLMTSAGPVNDENLDVILEAAGLDPQKIRDGMHDPVVTERLASTRALAQRLAISGTPTFIFGNQLVRGFLPLEQMVSLIEDIRMTN